MKAKPVFAFFLLAFGIAWGVPSLALWLSAQTGAFTVSMEEYSPLSYVALWAPALSAFIVIAANHGWGGVWAYASACRNGMWEEAGTQLSC